MNLPQNLHALCLWLVAALGHFLWQGAAIALLAGLAGALLRKSSAAARYRVFLAALAVMAACPVVTLLLTPMPMGEDAGATRVNPAAEEASVTIVTPPAPPVVVPSAPPTEADLSPLTPPSIAPASATAAPAPVAATAAPAAPSLWQRLSPYAAGAYLLGVAAMLIRLLAGLGGGVRLRRASEPITDPALLAVFARQARALGLRMTPALACCRRVGVPVVVGFVRPMVLLPLSMSAGLSADQVRAVLTHELAHIRRLDPLVNLLQRLVESLLFYHPGVWYVSRRIRVERENCCDDLAAGTGSHRYAYAESLLHLARRSLAESRERGAREAVGLGATGKPSLLRARVGRLIGGPDEPVRLGRTWPLAVLLVATVLTGTALLNLRAEIATTKPAEDPNATSAKDKPPATQPAGKPSVGIYLVTGRPENVPFEKVPLDDLTLADEPLIGERDIFEYDWESHTIRLKTQAVADRVLKRCYSHGTGAFVVVANGRQLYRGAFLSMISSLVPRAPVIHVGPTAGQFQPQMAVRIFPPPIAGTPDPRGDARLKQALRALKLLSRVGAATRPAATQPSDQLTRRSRQVLRRRLRNQLANLARLKRPREWLPDPNDVDKVLAATGDDSPVGMRRLATTRLLKWADQKKVLSRLAELARDEDAFVKLHATQVLALSGQRVNVDFLRNISSGRQVLSSSEFERDDAAWALLALGEKLPAAANNHSTFFDKTLEKIRALQQAGQNVGQDVLSGLGGRIRPVTQPAGSKLEFRVAPKPSDIDKRELADYMRWLKTGKVGFWYRKINITGRMPDRAWLPVASELTNAPQLTTGDHDGRKYMLVSDKPGQIMVPSEGKNAWGLTKVYTTKDHLNQPAIGFELDDRGAERFAALTKANVGSALAIVIDGEVVSAPKLMTALGKRGMITGRFSEKEATDLVKALKVGMGQAPSTPSTRSGQAGSLRVPASESRTGQVTQPADANANGVTILGEVPRPGVYDRRSCDSVRKLLAACGYKPGNKSHRVYVIRHGRKQEVVEWVTNVNEIIDGSAKDIPLAGGDVLMVEDILKSVERIAATDPAHARFRIKSARLTLDEARAKLADAREAFDHKAADVTDVEKAQHRVVLAEILLMLAEADARGDGAAADALRAQAAAAELRHKQQHLARLERDAKAGVVTARELEKARRDVKLAEISLVMAKARQEGDAVEQARQRVAATKVLLESARKDLARVEELRKHKAATERQVEEVRTEVKRAELAVEAAAAELAEERKRRGEAPTTRPAASKSPTEPAVNRSRFEGLWIQQCKDNPGKEEPTHYVMLLRPDGTWADVWVWGKPQKPAKLVVKQTGPRWRVEALTRPIISQGKNPPGKYVLSRHVDADSGRGGGEWAFKDANTLVAYYVCSITWQVDWRRADAALARQLEAAIEKARPATKPATLRVDDGRIRMESGDSVIEGRRLTLGEKGSGTFLACLADFVPRSSQDSGERSS